MRRPVPMTERIRAWTSAPESDRKLFVTLRKMTLGRSWSCPGSVDGLGSDPAELAREVEPSAQAIRNWVAQADRDNGHRSDGLPSSEKEELARLRRENRQLRQERDILAKAAAWFARETGTIPSGSSSS